MKLIPRTQQPPRHLTDREEEALLAAVSQHGNLRDRTLLIVALHTGDEQDVSAATRRNYASDLRQFAAWCERSWAEGIHRVNGHPTAN